MHFGLLLSLLVACNEKTEKRMEGTEVGDCTDRADNDGDGLFDCADQGCAGSPDCTRESVGDGEKAKESTQEQKNVVDVEKAKESVFSGLYTLKEIPAGSFEMGCTSEQGSDCDDDEKPSHMVEISKAFYLMESEVTQELYEKVMGNNLSYFTGSKRPVENVSWYDAVTFANKLSVLEGREQCYQMTSRVKDEYGDEQYDVSWTKNCRGWRLPTEAEWEYAARGGQSYKYAGSNTEGDVAWYTDNSGSSTHDVCGKQKNSYGLCDMSGNVDEWVWDWKGDYSTGTQVDPTGPTSDSNRVARGGSWNGSPRGLRVSRRGIYSPDSRYDSLGFRLGLSP